jgi:hypothetical protein
MYCFASRYAAFHTNTRDAIIQWCSVMLLGNKPPLGVHRVAMFELRGTEAMYRTVIHRTQAFLHAVIASNSFSRDKLSSHLLYFLILRP